MEGKLFWRIMFASVLLFCHGVFVCLATSYEAWPFRSSDENRAIAEREYASDYNSPAELYVATASGDEIPRMREDLIRRKHNGEGFFLRHYHAWTTLENWWYDPDNDRKELAN